MPQPPRDYRRRYVHCGPFVATMWAERCGHITRAESDNIVGIDLLSAGAHETAYGCFYRANTGGGAGVAS